MVKVASVVRCMAWNSVTFGAHSANGKRPVVVLGSEGSLTVSGMMDVLGCAAYE